MLRLPRCARHGGSFSFGGWLDKWKPIHTPAHHPLSISVHQWVITQVHNTCFLVSSSFSLACEKCTVQEKHNLQISSQSAIKNNSFHQSYALLTSYCSKFPSGGMGNPVPVCRIQEVWSDQEVEFVAMLHLPRNSPVYQPTKV